MSVKIIAEIGINHNGDLNICKEMIDVAKESGAFAIKLQKRDIDSVYAKDFLESSRDSPWGNTQRHQKEGLEFNSDEYDQIDDYCRNKEINWFASAWDLKSQQFLRKFNLKFNKVASAMIVHEKLLEEIAKEKKHTFISTGMSTHEQIEKAINIFHNYKCSYELMHTVSTYPTKPCDANLRVINDLKNRYKCNVGYSGHENGTAISFAAVALGITSLERHLTLDRTMYGSDQAASLEPDGFRNLVKGVRKVELALGDGEKRIIDDEVSIAKKLRAHIL